jgi:peptide/nickel transport system substrate-binding protein
MAEDGSRRRLSPAGMIGGLIALVVVVLVVVSLASGGDDDGDDTKPPANNAAAASGSTERADTLVLGQFRPPTGKIGNPYVQASDALISDGVHELVFEALFYTNYQSGETEPWLAESFEYGDGNKSVTLNLRDDVTWNDGKPFTADDVVFTLEQIKKAKAPYRAANIQAAVKSVKALSPTQVEITLNAPNPRFVQSELSSYVYTANFIPMPKHIFQGKKFDTFAFFDLGKGWPVGTGPYTLKEIDASSATLTRNEDWWAAKAGVKDLPAPSRVVYTTPGPEDSAVSSLETNKVDYVGQSVPTVAGFISARKQNPNLVNWDGDLGWLDPCPFSLTINTKNKPWDDPDMRWGLNAAIDKEQFSQLFNTPGEPTAARSPYPEYPQLTQLLDANQDLFDTYPTLQHDVSKSDEIFTSKRYTKQDGVWTKDGKPLTLKLNLFNPAALGPVWGDAAQLLNQQFKAAGIKVDLQPGDFNLVASNRAEGKFDAQSWFECGSVTDPWSTLNRYTDAPGNDNAGKWSNAEFEKIVAQMGELPPGDEKIQDLFTQAMEIWLKELPVIPLVQRPTPIVMNQTYWKNWPTAENAYTDPAPWGMNFHQVVTQLESARSGQ